MTMTSSGLSDQRRQQGGAFARRSLSGAAADDDRNERGLRRQESLWTDQQRLQPWPWRDHGERR